MPKFYIATVLANDANLAAIPRGMTGEVQISIDHLMNGFLTDDFPWAKPAASGTGGGLDQGLGMIPEVGSLVWVFFEDEEFMRNPFYLADVNLKQLNPYLTFETIRASAGMETVYPDVKFLMLKNGITVALSSGAIPEVSIMHPAGSSIKIDKLGAIEIKGGAALTEKMVLGETLIAWLASHQHPTAVGPSGPPITAGALTTVLSILNKNN